jgi:hypothetical protein
MNWCSKCDNGINTKDTIYRCQHKAQKFKVLPDRENITISCFYPKNRKAFDILVEPDPNKEFNWPQSVDESVILKCGGFENVKNR